MVRPRRGEVHAGWALSTISRREVTLVKNDRAETLALKSEAPVATGLPGMPANTAIGADLYRYIFCSVRSAFAAEERREQRALSKYAPHDFGEGNVVKK